MEGEFERDDTVQHLRKCGHERPIDRETYIGFDWASLSLKDWGWEHEFDLPELLRDYSGTQWPWKPKCMSRRRTSK
jgi:hypothetical protein